MNIYSGDTISYDVDTHEMELKIIPMSGDHSISVSVDDPAYFCVFPTGIGGIESKLKVFVENVWNGKIEFSVSRYNSDI